MALELMYITNNPAVALIAEKCDVQRIWIDLEVLGKEERQKNLNTVKSHHTIQDINIISKVLTKSKLMVRINPWNPKSIDEIEQVIESGAERIMLPMWKNAEEVSLFLNTVNKRVSTTLLLETKEAVDCIDEVLKHPLLDEMHIGLNDLHLSYGLDFMFELLSNGIIEMLCNKMKKRGIKYGFGGIACIGEGLLPAEMIIMEHYRLGSTRAILSRSFCDANDIDTIEEVENIFSKNMQKLRVFEQSIGDMNEAILEENKNRIKERVNKIVKKNKGE